MKNEIKAIYYKDKEKAFKYINAKLKERDKGELGYIAFDFNSGGFKGCLVLDEKDLSKLDKQKS